MSNENKKKLPLYVEVYDKIIKLIQEGVYPIGSKLPAEVQLSKLMGVSRLTLRQALSFLQDDGYIETRHGQGNFIKDNLNIKYVGLEKITHPVLQCCTETIDEVEASKDIYFVNDYEFIKKTFQMDSALIIEFNRWFKSNNNQVAYAYTVFPAETASQYKINLNDQADILHALEEEIYTWAHSSTIEIKFITSLPDTSGFIENKQQSLFALLIENLYDSMGNTILSNRFYIPAELCSLRVNRVNR